ncbi:hypothetical protein PENTCL1PPCAC_12436, partial [Pristionchus entomophagus]
VSHFLLSEKSLHFLLSLLISFPELLVLRHILEPLSSNEFAQGLVLIDVFHLLEQGRRREGTPRRRGGGRLNKCVFYVPR